jgi:hypothetical protein
MEETMAMRMLRRIGRAVRSAAVCSILAGMAISTNVRSAAAEGFRIETKVYVGEEKKKQEPVSETTTLFLNGAVYDFLKEPEQTAVFREPAGGRPGQFILLDDEHSVQTKFSTEKVAGAMTKLRQWATHQQNPFLQFAANPQFDESFDRDNGKLVLSSHFETYTVATEPMDHPDELIEYREFLDWYTQLNTLISAERLPPEPRLRVNAVLVQHKVVPTKVELTRAGEEPLRAKHEFTWRLSQDDRKRIDDVRASISTYRDVANEEFLQMTKPKDTNR